MIHESRKQCILKTYVLQLEHTFSLLFCSRRLSEREADNYNRSNERLRRSETSWAVGTKSPITCFCYALQAFNKGV